MKKTISILMVLLMTVSIIAGCTPAKQEPSAPSGDGLSIALVLATGGLGDKSLNDSAYDGIMKCKEQFNAEVQYVQPREVAEFESHQREFAKSGKYDLIVTVGFDQADSLMRVAPEFPEQHFIAIDATVEGLDNVMSISYKDHEKMYLLGIIAGSATTTKKVGIVGGMDIPLINRFVAGFMAGVAYADKSVEVLYKYVGDWADATTGKELALSMYAEGCDIIVGAAGGSSLGVFAAAAEVDKYAIPVDTYQIPNDPKHFMANAIREVGNAALAAVGTYVDGNFQGGFFEYGLKENVVSYSVEGAEFKLADDVIPKVEDAKSKIIAGEIIVPQTIDEAKSYAADLG